MKPLCTSKKESGAQGRKRRKLEAEEVKKSSKLLMLFFEKPTTCEMDSPAQATSLLEGKGRSCINATEQEHCKTIKPLCTSKKESGAQGRKRRKLEEEEAKKSSKLLMLFFEKPTSSSKCGIDAPATSLLEGKDRSCINVAQAEEVKSEYDQIKREADTLEQVDMPGGKHNNDGGEDFLNRILPDISELDGVKEPGTVKPEVIEHHDVGLLKFDRHTGKAILCDLLKMEIIKLGSKYFQNSEGPFLPTNNRSMTQAWFKRKLGNGCAEDVSRSWLLYSPSKRSAFCICCLLYSQSTHQSSLEQESGFNHWKAPERICQHDNSKNHLDCFTQWKEMEQNVVENQGVDVHMKMTPRVIGRASYSGKKCK